MSLSRSVFAAAAVCAALLCAAPAAATTTATIGPPNVTDQVLELFSSNGSQGETGDPDTSASTGKDTSSPSGSPSPTPSAPAVALAPQARAAQNRFDCKDFPNRDAAQAKLEEDPSDPNILDRDNDGKACETFFEGSGSTGGQVPVMPSGGVDAGGGPAGDASPLGVLGVLAGLSAAGAGVVAGRRRLARRGN